MTGIKPLETKPLPPALPLRKLIGPSFVLLGMGLGSGEVVLWPFLTSNYGMGIIWGAILGILFQFFMNMEIERYALVHGESIFVGFARKLKWLPAWFLFSTFLPWIWPGITASAARVIGSFFGIENIKWLSIGILIAIGVILSVGPVLYKTVERFQKTVTLLGVPVIFLLAILLAKSSDWAALANGVVGIGEGYRFLPAGIPLASFLAALAYAGAGGNLNLAQSNYVKAKGYAMGQYGGQIKGLLTGKQDEIELSGSKFETTPENMAVFKKWWKNVNLEHFVVFFITGAVTMVLLGLLSYSTVYKNTQDTEGINFLLLEAQVIGQRTVPFLGSFFLVIAALTLIGTQLGVFDATSRMLSENLVLLRPNKKSNIPRLYYTLLWAQILAGVVIFLFGFTQPLQLLTIAAVLNAFTMFVHVGLTLWLNKTLLAKELRPNLFRTVMMILGFLLYGGFSVYTIVDQFFL